VTAGSGFVRCVYEPAVTPTGPSTGPLATAFWDFIGRDTGADTLGLTSALDVAGEA